MMIGENRHLADNAKLNKHRKVTSETSTRERQANGTLTRTRQMTSFLSLPDELLRELLRLLPVPAAGALSSACSTTRGLLDDKMAAELVTLAIGAFEPLRLLSPKLCPKLFYATSREIAKPFDSCPIYQLDELVFVVRFLETTKIKVINPNNPRKATIKSTTSPLTDWLVCEAFDDIELLLPKLPVSVTRAYEGEKLIMQVNVAEVATGKFVKLIDCDNTDCGDFHLLSSGLGNEAIFHQKMPSADFLLEARLGLAKVDSDDSEDDDVPNIGGIIEITGMRRSCDGDSTDAGALAFVMGIVNGKIGWKR